MIKDFQWILKVCHGKGIKVNSLSTDFSLRLWQRKNKKTFSIGTLTELTDTIAFRLLETRFYALQLLQEKGIPTVDFLKTNKLGEVSDFLSKHKKIKISRVRLNERNKITATISEQKVLKKTIKNFFNDYNLAWDGQDRLPTGCFLTDESSSDLRVVVVCDFKKVYFGDKKDENKGSRDFFIEASKIFRSPVVVFYYVIVAGKVFISNSSAYVPFSLLPNKTRDLIANEMVSLLIKRKLI